MTTLPQWFVYFLRSRKRSFIYVGSTHNRERRLIEHNDGMVQSTKAYRPLEIIAFVAVKTEKHARQLEKYFKTGSGKAIAKKQHFGESRAELRLADMAGCVKEMELRVVGNGRLNYHTNLSLTSSLNQSILNPS